jgi:DNA-binding IclR family transcriptional regulator
MVALRDLTGETVTLNVRSGFDRVCIDQAEGPHEVSWRQDIGKISPLYAGATGKVLLAYLSPEELKAYFHAVKPQRLTEFTIVRRDDIRRELQAIRKQGYAFGTQDRIIGVAGVSAPIFDAGGRAAGTLTIAGPAERCTPEKRAQWVEPLIAATAQISQFVADAALAGPDATSQLFAAPVLAGGVARR